MAASAATASSSSGLCPNYAVICSFLERYGALLDLPELTFPQLERYLQDTSSVPKLLVDLHVKLLRKIGKSVSADRWEKYLVKVCQEFNTTWAWELEQKGYKELTIDCKTGILKYLCECQFDENVKFKTAINEEDPDKMRLQPIGRDKDGQMYWFQLDQDNNVRVYVEEQDDLDGSTWKCIVRDRNDLAEVVALLKTQIDPELLKKEAQKQETKPDGDEEKKGEEGKVKTNDDTSDEDNKDSDKAAGPVSPKTQNKEQLTQKENLKAEAAEAKSSLNGVVEGKTEAELRSEIVTAKTQNIKEEPMEVLDSKMSTATSEPAPEKPSLLVKPEKGEEAKRTSAEEIQQALKNDQQAKIPLKKRGMKFSEDFEKNSSIVIQNPPVSQVREASKADATQNINDHVNGEITPAAEKDLPGHMSKPLKEASSDREQATEPAEGKSAEVREKDSPATDRDGGKDEKDGAKKITGAVASHRTDNLVQKNLAAQVESESAAMAEKKEAHESPPLPKAESPPLSKDVNNAAEESLKHEKSEKMQEKPAITGEPSAEDKTTTLKETDKTLTTDESEKLNLNHEVTSKEAESKGSEEKVACVDVETSESSQAEEKKTTERTGDLSDAKQTGVSDEDAKELATSETKAEESTVSAPKEGKPGVIKTAEIQSANKDMPKKSDDSENTEIPSVIKKTEIVKEGHDTESQEVTESSSVIKKTEMVKEGDDTESQEVTGSSLVIKKTEMVKEGDDTESQEVTESSPVIKKAETPSVGEKSEETSDIKEGTESSVIKKVDKSESCKPTEKHEDVKDTEVTPEGDCAASAKTEKPGDVKKIVNCDDSTIHDGTKTSNSTCEPMEVEAPASKQDLMKLQEDNKTEMNSVVHKTTQETSEGKDKPSSPAEKSNISEDTDEKPKKEEEKVSEEQPQRPQWIETEHPSSESEKDAEKGKEKDAGKEKLAEDSEKHPTQDGERKEDSTIDESPKADEAKEEEHANEESKTSPKTEKSGHQNESKEADVEPSTETEKIGQPSKEPSADKPTDEKSKSKCREDEAMTKKEVANGGEAPMGIREEGIRRKAKPPAHRRKAELQREERQGDSESDTNVGRSLRRSPRISRPTPKAVEINDRKMEKSQTTPPAEKREESKAEKEKEKEEEEEEEAREVKAAQKKPREKKADQEGQPKPKGRKRRKIRWSNTRTRRKKKGSEDDNSDEESSEEEESEEEDDSDEDYKVERSRKRRNRNRERRSSDSSTSSDDDLPPNDDPCKHCGLPNHPELILLCDSCDSGYHTACLRPPLMIIPDGEWFCPPCQHKLLCDKLEEQLQNLDAALKKKERAERRKERLIYVGISVENIITPSVEVEVEEEKPEIIIKEKKETKRSKSWGRRSTRTKKNISYRFDEFDEAIEEAIEEDIKEAEGGGAGRGKDMANITGHRGKDMSAILQAEEGKENGRPPRPSAGQRKKKRRRLNDLDSDSTVDEEESEEEFRLSESSEEEFVVSDNDSDAESEADSNDSDFGSNSSGKHRTSSRSRKPPKRRRSSRKRRRPRGYSDDEEDETDEDDEEDEIATEGSSEFSDSDLDVSRRRSRRSQKRQVNYCETSESEGSQAETNRVKMKPRRRQDSSESDASFSRDSEEDSRDRRVKRRADSSEEDSRQRRRRLALKRRRASEDDDSDDSSDDSSEEDRPIRKRVNRIDSDDDEEEQEEKPKEKKAEEESKGTNPLDSNLVELPPTNGQSPMKSLEGLISRPAAATATAATPGLIPHLEPPKNISATPATAAIAPNGLAGQEMAAQDDDEDDLLGVTDLVDYVCNNEQL